MEEVPAAVHAASGAIGSSIANFLLYPLDVVTVRLQVQRDSESAQELNDDDSETETKSNSDELEAVPINPNPSSLREMFLKTLQEDGWPAFFEGIGDDLIATASQSFIYFFVYDYLRNKQIRYHTRRRGAAPHTFGIQQELLFGAVAGLVCKLFTTPLKNVVVLKQTDPARKRTFADCINEICEHKGVTGLWSGYRATAFLSINPSLAYYFYQRLSPYNNQRDSSYRVFARGAVAKSIATVLTYPVILEKTRTQAKKEPSDLYTNLWRTLRTYGISGLYDGVNGQLLKGCFTQGITMASKESISRFVVYVYSNFILRRRRKRLVIR